MTDLQSGSIFKSGKKEKDHQDPPSLLLQAEKNVLLPHLDPPRLSEDLRVQGKKEVQFLQDGCEDLRLLEIIAPEVRNGEEGVLLAGIGGVLHDMLHPGVVVLLEDVAHLQGHGVRHTQRWIDIELITGDGHPHTGDLIPGGNLMQTAEWVQLRLEHSNVSFFLLQ